MDRVTTPDAVRWDLFGRTMMSRPIAVTAEDELEFHLAMDQYKKESGRMFPTWSEILEVLRSIGYAKRIWKPVETWAPLAVSSNEDDAELSTTVGWFATVETPVGP